jgi:predicted lipase
MRPKLRCDSHQILINGRTPSTRERTYTGAVSFELRHLRAFVAVAEELNFTRAGRRLHIAQQALSSQIRQLEDRLGTTLLDRTPRKVELTPAGEAFYRETVVLTSPPRAVQRLLFPLLARFAATRNDEPAPAH